MISKWLWMLRNVLRQLWVRVAAYAVTALVAAAAAPSLSHFVPEGWAEALGAGAVDEVLSILTTSMLAVTTFSLSIAVNAYSAAAQTATPRAIALLQGDPTSQKTLATFLGAFVFAIVSVIGLSANLYDAGARVILFAATIVVIVLVVLALFRWMGYLQDFGRMENILDQVEEAACDALITRLCTPYLGGHPATDPAPEYAHDVLAEQPGYVQHLDVEGLNDWAEGAGAQVWLVAMPGAFLYPGAPLVRVNGPAPSEAAQRKIRAAFSVGRQRSFDQDPEHGMIVLSEIASRALSPAVNDPGTAIAAVDRQLAVLLKWQTRKDPEVTCRAIHAPALSPAQITDAAFRPVIRDAATNSEVLARLLTTFQALRLTLPEVFDAPVTALLADLDERVRRADGLSEWDQQRLATMREP